MYLAFGYTVGTVLEQLFSCNILRWTIYTIHKWWTRSIKASSLLGFLPIYSNMLKYMHYILLLGSVYFSACGNWIILLLLWSFLPSQPFSSHPDLFLKNICCLWHMHIYTYNLPILLCAVNYKVLVLHFSLSIDFNCFTYISLSLPIITFYFFNCK